MGWVDSLTASLLVSLRLAPTLAFAQPFTLLRVPLLVRMMIAVGLALWLVDARPALTVDRLGGTSMVGVFAGELAIGLSIALSLQLAFAAILWAGRVLDIQAGFGLALLTDPTTQNNQPLVGTVLAYAAGIIFMTTGALYDLLALWLASLETRGTRADAETHDKLFLFKNVALLRATYQVRLLLYRAIQEHKKLLIDMPKDSKVHSDLKALARDYRNHIEIVKA